MSIKRWSPELNLPDYSGFVEMLEQAQTMLAELRDIQPPRQRLFYLAMVERPAEKHGGALNKWR